MFQLLDNITCTGVAESKDGAEVLCWRAHIKEKCDLSEVHNVDEIRNDTDELNSWCPENAADGGSGREPFQIVPRKRGSHGW